MFVNVFSVGALTFGSNGSHAMVLDTIHEITENNESLGYAVGDFKMVFKKIFIRRLPSKAQLHKEVQMIATY